MTNQEKSKAIQNALEWHDDTIPVSTRFDDPYFSRADGLGETRYVFIDGNDLPSRFATMKNYQQDNKNEFIIAELGFGTGLNFLATLVAFKTLAPAEARLRFISFERYPLQTDEIKKALSRWPELDEWAAILLAHWQEFKLTKENPASVVLQFGSNIELEIIIGDANATLPKQDFAANAWFLDGFSPAKNPQMWNEELLKQVHRLTALDGSFATYAAAGFVRRNLIAAGFAVERRPGFGLKREMLCGRWV